MAQSIDAVMAEIISDFEVAIRTLERRIATARRVINDPDQLRQLAAARIRARAERYDWEYEDDQQTSFPQQLWGGLVVDAATGEGVTQRYFVTWARTDAEFRRRLAHRVGRHLAHAALVCDSRSLAPEAQQLVSPQMALLIGRIADGVEASPGFDFFVELHRNLS